jgi:hypothetical protein
VCPRRRGAQRRGAPGGKISPRLPQSHSEL